MGPSTDIVFTSLRNISIGTGDVLLRKTILFGHLDF